MSSSETDLSPVVHCAAHPGTVSYLRCAQCNVSICPRCLVMTPVGAKCPRCARGRLQAAFLLTPIDVVVAFVACVVTGVIVGLIGSELVRFVHILGGLLFIAFPIGMGLAMPEVLARVVPRKHGTTLKVAAGLGVAIGFLTLGLGDFVLLGPVDLLQSGMILPLLRNLLVSMVINPFNVLFLGLGVWVAVSRTY